MPILPVRVCQCLHCQQEIDHPNRHLHRQMNLLLSRLDEQQRRWFVALEANPAAGQTWPCPLRYVEAAKVVNKGVVL